MPDIVETVGRLITDQTAHSPQNARRILEAAYGWVSLGALDKLPSYKSAEKRYNAEIARTITHALMHPQDCAIVNIFMPCEILRAMDITPMYPEGISAYVANTACANTFAEAAEARNVPESLCSYHKVMIGMAESGVLPAPALITNTTLTCDANQVSFRRLAQRYDVPHYVIDVPHRISEESVRYVADQLIEMTALIEEVTGKHLDSNKLSAILERSAKTITTLKQYQKLRAHVTIPTTSTGELLAMMATHFGLGSKAALRYAEDLLSIAKRAQPATTSQKPRIFWMHTLPNWQMSMRAIFDGQDASCELVGTDLMLDYPEEADPSRPFETLARRIVYTCFNGPGKRRVESALNYALELNIDGAIIFCHWGCKQTLGISQLAKHAFEDHNIPVLILDGDGCDPRNVADGQMITRVNAFLEQLEGVQSHDA